MSPSEMFNAQLEARAFLQRVSIPLDPPKEG
jgi:hypothetical protein